MIKINKTSCTYGHEEQLHKLNKESIKIKKLDHRRESVSIRKRQYISESKNEGCYYSLALSKRKAESMTNFHKNNKMLDFFDGFFCDDEKVKEVGLFKKDRRLFHLTKDNDFLFLPNLPYFKDKDAENLVSGYPLSADSHRFLAFFVPEEYRVLAKHIFGIKKISASESKKYQSMIQRENKKTVAQRFSSSFLCNCLQLSSKHAESLSSAFDEFLLYLKRVFSCNEIDYSKIVLNLINHEKFNLFHFHYIPHSKAKPVEMEKSIPVLEVIHELRYRGNLSRFYNRRMFFQSAPCSFVTENHNSAYRLKEGGYLRIHPRKKTTNKETAANKKSHGTAFGSP